MVRMKRSMRAAVFALVLLLAGAAQGYAQKPVRVRIAAGQIEGTELGNGVQVFRGIPFAAPPVGQLRWQEPQEVKGWGKEVRSAVDFGPRCMQLPVFGDMVFRSRGMSEDCLYLNVWVPANAHRRRTIPVLLYFYGGGNIAGDGSEYRYDGEAFARRGIIVVTANYRLGVFGWLAHPELTRESRHRASGDYGLLDQVAAIDWVRRNIVAFHGDPRKVTIGGESAGSIAVSALMASPLSRRNLAGAIGESGALIGRTLTPVPLAEAEQLGVRFAQAVAATSLAQLRAIPADSLLKATADRRLAYFPIVIDGYVLPRTPAEIYAAGEQAHVPLLVGWNTQEAGWQALLGNQPPTPENYAAAVRRQLGADADEALRYFPGGTQDQVIVSATRLAGAGFIAYGTWKWAELQGRTGLHPVFRYLYAHPRPAPVTPGPNPPPLGAVHSAEIEYALGNLATNKVYAWTPDDSTLSAAMQEYWVNFVKTGSPNGGTLPAWPSAVGDGGQVMVLDVRPHAKLVDDRAEFVFLDRVFSAASLAAPR